MGDKKGGLAQDQAHLGEFEPSDCKLFTTLYMITYSNLHCAQKCTKKPSKLLR